MSSGETKPLLEKRRSSGSGDKKRFYFIQDRHPSQVSHDGQIQREAPEIEISTIPVRGDPSLLDRMRTSVAQVFRWRQSGTNHKQRKIPIKIEPKVFFANERTFLAWLHMSITLAAIAIGIVAFAETNKWSMVYGLVMMPVAILFCCYSLWIYITRADMIRRKDPGPYENRIGPIVLAALLGFSILTNFFVKLYDALSATD